MLNGKKTLGRQKVEMKRMTNESNMKVTFSKRRSGLFKKVSELCTLCGVDVALVLFSPGEKVYSFGHPNVDTVIDRYLSQVPQNNGTIGFIEAQCNANICDKLNSHVTHINNILDTEKRHMDELSQIHNMTLARYWWARPFDGMNWDQLEFLVKKLENFKNLIAQHANRHVIEGVPTQTLPFFGGNSSSSNMSLHHQPNPQQAQNIMPFFYGNPSSSNMSLHHQPNSQQAQNFPAQIFENPMLQPHLFGFNNMGGGGGFGASGFS